MTESELRHATTLLNEESKIFSLIKNIENDNSGVTGSVAWYIIILMGKDKVLKALLSRKEEIELELKQL